MNKTLLGTILILTGMLYGTLAFDIVYEKTLGFLIQNKWLNPPAEGELNQNLFGKKVGIIFYSLCLILIGIYLLWNRNI